MGNGADYFRSSHLFTLGPLGLVSYHRVRGCVSFLTQHWTFRWSTFSLYAYYICLPWGSLNSLHVRMTLKTLEWSCHVILWFSLTQCFPKMTPILSLSDSRAAAVLEFFFNSITLSRCHFQNKISCYIDSLKQLWIFLGADTTGLFVISPWNCQFSRAFLLSWGISLVHS